MQRARLRKGDGERIAVAFFFSPTGGSTMPHPYTKIVQATIVGVLHGQETNNVLHFGGNGVDPALAALLADILDCIVTAFRPAASNEWALTKVSGRPLFPQLGDPIDLFPNAPVTGSGLPAETSFSANIIRINTGLGGRRHRGRMFMPAVIANDVNQSKLTDNGLAKLAAFAACLAGKFIAAPGAVDQKVWEIGVLSRTQAKAEGQTMETGFTPATVLTAQRVVGVMRSRRIGHGN
jgi:hypothetical protein